MLNDVVVGRYSTFQYPEDFSADSFFHIFLFLPYL